ncbi:MAG: Plug domain-containing protein [Tannerella sp.]|nr:Plug domain-containing protein [Tannerella sp.]
MKGYIESPGEYFRKNNRQAIINLDYLMMTQGWRRYDVDAILQGNYQTPHIEWDGGLALSGIVRGGYNSSPIEGSNLTLYAATGNYFASTETDQNGQFRFMLPDTPDSALFRVELKPSLSYGNNSITFDTPAYPRFNRPYKGTLGSQIQTDNTFAWNIKLPDIGVTARKREPKPKPISDFTRYASHTLDQAYLENRPVLTWENVLSGIPGANVLKKNNDIFVFLGRIGGLEGVEPAHIMLDGVLLSNNAFLSDIEILDVAQIDIIKGTRAAIFGSEGMGGVISVTTKTAGGTKRQTNGNIVKMVYPLGCQQSIEFYSPSYTVRNEQISTKDMRKTLFWKPNINTNESSEASFDFYSADIPTSYTILIERVSDDGKLIHHISKVQLVNE